MRFLRREEPVATELTVRRCGGWAEREHAFSFHILAEEEPRPIRLHPVDMAWDHPDVREALSLTSPGDRIELKRRGIKVVGFRNLTLEGMIPAEG